MARQQVSRMAVNGTGHIAEGPSLRAQFQALDAELNGVLVERQEAISNALYAILAGEHFLQLGGGGIAKSMLVDELTARVTGAQQFTILVGASTMPEEFLGPQDIPAMVDEKRWVRWRAGSITEAHFSFIDEIYKCNSFVLNLLLKILNERMVSEVGAPPFRIPLLSVFAASNEGAPRGLEAFNDRFVLRQMVQDIKDDDNFLAMLEAEDQDPETFLSLDSIAAAQAERQAIAVPRAVKERVIELRHALETERIFPSPRRYKKAMKVLQARAWMDGLPEVDMDCCTVLRHVLWTDAKEEGIVRKLVHEAFSPLSVAAGAMADMALSLLVGGIPDKSDSDFMVRCEDATRQLVNMQERHVLEMTRSGARDMRASLDALQEVERIKKAVARLTIGQARDEVLKAAQSGA